MSLQRDRAQGWDDRDRTIPRPFRAAAIKVMPLADLLNKSVAGGDAEFRARLVELERRLAGKTR